jgi:hypothetical protein
MSVALLKRYITEVMMSQNVIRKDPEGTGQLVIRKLVTFKKPASRFAPGEDVDTEFDSEGNAVVDDIEKWMPDFETSRRKATSKTHKHTTRLA